ncbi:hypothetical protein HanIR_Chr04g0151711 [Helianthus annuus]|nr:hypothetical protein HanIR_Chr04g0151711 [Helianthus annuus]
MLSTLWSGSGGSISSSRFKSSSGHGLPLRHELFISSSWLSMVDWEDPFMTCSSSIGPFMV